MSVMSVLYHGSDQKGLERIIPQLSTHGKRYVYATKYPAIALLFLCRWNDYLLTLETAMKEDRLQINLVERYPNAFEEIYAGNKGYIYTLKAEQFIHDPSCWDMELVSEHEEMPISCTEVSDVLAALKTLEGYDEISLYHYPKRPKSIPDDESDLIDKSIELYQLNGDLYNARYCIEKFPHLRDRLAYRFKKEFNIDSL
ncbi:MAG: hypothetical protein GX096_12180 [Clostridiales bacterium]|nr:hypothetical protein [Clostridiales bacterium]